MSRKHAIAGAVHSAKTYSRDNSVVHQSQPKSQMEVVSKSRKSLLRGRESIEFGLAGPFTHRSMPREAEEYSDQVCPSPTAVVTQSVRPTIELLHSDTSCTTIEVAGVESTSSSGSFLRY